jgi:patatin-like phospholipase/acyl hydrolase
VTVRVLSLDGGGIRGILPARVLAELEQITGRPVSALFDLIAGTATGAVLALGLAAPGEDGRPRFRAQELVDLYVERGHQLFPEPDPTHRLRHLLGLRRARHPAAGPLLEHFGEVPLGDALVEVIVPTFDCAASAPLLLQSKEFRPGLGPPMRDVALASSSVPTHYPLVGLELGSRTMWLTHGGLVANNPALFAYVESLSRAEPDEVVFVSLGTGSRPSERSNGSRDRGRRWPLSAARSFDLHLEGQSKAQHQVLDSLLRASGDQGRYWRIQPTLRPHLHDFGFSDPVSLSYLADEFVVDSRSTLNEIADRVAA